MIKNVYSPRSILIVLTFVATLAGTTRAQPTTTTNSPVQIARAINSQRNFVQAGVYLKILWENLKIPAGAFNSDACGYGCEADVFQHNLDNEVGNEAVLKLTGGEACRYLIFKRSQRQWHFLGYVDHDFNRYKMSTHRVVQKLLVVTGQAGSGTGLSLYGDTYYRVDKDGVNPVLRYWVSGHTFPWPNGLGREFKTVVSSKLNQIVVTYIVKYTMLDYTNDQQKVWITNTHRVRYRWDNNQNKFAFDPNGSDLSEAGVAAIANAEKEDDDSSPRIGNTTFPDKQKFIGGGYQVFLKSNLVRLKRIARGPNSVQKRWLQAVLRETAETPEKKALLAVLEQSR